MIQNLLDTKDLTQTEVAHLTGLPQPKFLRLLHGHFRGISEAKTMECARLGQDVRVVIGPPPQTGQPGRVQVVHG